MFCSSRLLRLVAPVAAVALALAGSSSLALAHAQYQSSNPPSNGTLSSLPQSLQVTYTEELASVHFDVTGPDGSNATAGPASIDLEHRQNASVPLRNAGPGQYTVVWHNVSGDDGDPNDGSFVFTIAAPAAAAASATPAPPSTPTPVPATSASSTQPAAAASPSATGASAGASATGDDAITPGINDVRINTYRKRQTIRDQYAGKIDVLVFNLAVADGEGLESALKDATAAHADTSTGTGH